MALRWITLSSTMWERRHTRRFSLARGLEERILTEVDPTIEAPFSHPRYSVTEVELIWRSFSALE